MRGRTNAEPNIGVQLNASVDSFVIANYQNILAGDFVEQFNYLAGETTTTGNLIDQFPQDEQNIFKMSDGNYLYFGVYNSSAGSSYRNLEIYHKDEYGVLSLVTQPTSISYSSVGNTLIVQLEDDTLAYLYVNSEMQVFARLIHYNSANYAITNKSITASIASVSGASSWQFTIIKKRGGGYKVFASYYKAGGTSDVYSADMVITGNTYDTYAISLSNIKTIQMSGRLSCSLGFVVELDANYYLAMYGYKSSSSSSTTYYAYYVADENNNIEHTHSTSSNPLITGKLLNRNSFNNMVYTIYVDTTNDKVYRKKLYIDTSEYTVFPDEEIFDFSSEYTQANYLGTDGTNDIYIIQKSVTELVPFTINRTTGEMTIYIGCILDFSMGLRYMVASTLDNNNFLMASSNKMISMRYSNGTLESEVETVKRVRGITTQKYIKGVAKQSGTSGDTIQVYVPTVNS